MKKFFLSLCLMAIILSGYGQNKTVDLKLTVDLNSKGATVPSSMYGVFFEEINHAGDGGIYAEMLMNRSFEERVLPKGGYSVQNGELIPPSVPNHLAGKPTTGKFKWGKDPYPGWSLSDNTKATISLTTDFPNFESSPTNMQVEVNNNVSLINSGYWGIAVKKGEKYNLRMFISTPLSYKGNITARLVAKDGKELARKVVITRNNGKWNEYTPFLIATDNCTDAKLYLDMNAKGTVGFDYVSLFPAKTFKGRKNGMRQDVGQFLADMRPAFIRWPGGCVVEGISLSNHVEWKKTLGDPAARQGEYDTWGYHTTYGFGMKEFLDYCEDTGAKGMYVCNVGMGCQARCGDVCSEDDVEFYVKDALDAIEYAIGDATTKWGAVRAKEGHPAKYPLAYVEIGNENSGPVYDKRFDIFYKAIKAKYPQLTLISNHGSVKDLKGIDKTDMVDPHWYVEPNFFFKNAKIFDNEPRNGVKVYVGEYACNQGVGGGNMLAALSEAAFITGMERNSDLVTMASYAPLLENVNDRGWPTNLIWLNNHAVIGRSSYYVQKMFAENMPTYNLKATAEYVAGPQEPVTQSGYIGLGTWKTQSQFKDLKITKANGEVVTPNMNDKNQWAIGDGDWAVKDGVYTQNSNNTNTALIWKNEKFEDCTIEFKARKMYGEEGFLVYFGLQKQDLSKGTQLNIGGWGNTQTALQPVSDKQGGSQMGSVGDKVASDKWYTIKLTINKLNLEYSIDGQTKMKYEGKPIDNKFFVQGYDEKTKEYIIKVVNADTKPCYSEIKLEGAEVLANGKVITMSAVSNTDENSFEQPYKVSPIETTYDKFSNSFSYEFKPNSLTFFRIKKK